MNNKAVLAVLIVCICFGFGVAKKPVLYIIGDSISMGYGQYLDTDLGGTFTVQRKEDNGASINLDIPRGANGGDSRMVLDYLKLKEKEADFHPDVLLLNCGLHDIKRDKITNKIVNDEAQYRQNLEAIYTIAVKKKIQLVWVASTNIVDSIHNQKGSLFYRYTKDLQQYNSIANDVFLKHNVPIIDLYTFTIKLGGNRYRDHAHFTPETEALQGAYIAGFLQSFYNTVQITKQ